MIEQLVRLLRCIVFWHNKGQKQNGIVKMKVNSVWTINETKSFDDIQRSWYPLYLVSQTIEKLEYRCISKISSSGTAEQ